VLGWQRWRDIEECHGFGLLRTALKAAAKARGLKDEPVDEMAHVLLAAPIEGALLISRAEKPTAVARSTGGP
jgi:hypothetical protein